MTKENMTNKENVLPFLLTPAIKHCLWGGNKIRNVYGKGVSEPETGNASCVYHHDGVGETWECSTNEGGISIVASGCYKGLSLKEVLQMHPEYLGCWQNPEGELPILVKLIDAKKDLSIQVHPDDNYAMQNENGSKGKTEMWYILEAGEESRIIYGLEHNVTREQFASSLLRGTAEKYLKKVSVKSGDSFLIKAGTIHGIGEGILLAEVQENSNITYRLYDYNRVGQDRKPRELHIEKGLEVSDLCKTEEPRQGLRQFRYGKGYASQSICTNHYFQMEKLLLNTQCCREMAVLTLRQDTFYVLLCIDGCGTLFTEQEDIYFFKGDCIFVPANVSQLKLHGKAQFLQIRSDR